MELEPTTTPFNSLRFELNDVQEKSIQIRERKASSGATIEGLKKRKEDILERIQSEFNLGENDILENSNLNGLEELPDSVSQEEMLDQKKRDREKPKNKKRAKTCRKWKIDLARASAGRP